MTENLFYMKSTIQLEDNIFDIFELDEYELSFFEPDKQERIYKNQPAGIAESEKEYFRLYLRASTSARFYKREMYDILDWLGDLGGLKEIVIYFGIILTQNFVGRLLVAQLVAQTYKVQKYGHD